MLGYDVEFGHTQALHILSSIEFSNKQIVNILFFKSYFIPF